MASNPSNFDNQSSFVQFALGVGSSATFKNLLKQFGVPFAVLSFLVLVAAVYRLRPFRVITWLNSTGLYTHPAQGIWLSFTYYLFVVASVVLLMIWGIWTAAAVTPAMFGVGILLLIPAFFLTVCGIMLWRSRGWRFREYEIPEELKLAVAAGLPPSGCWDSCYTRMSSCSARLRRHFNPVPFCFMSALLLFTGYELSVVFNGDTISVTSGGTIKQTYIHSYLSLTWLFVTWNMVCVIFSINSMLAVPRQFSVEFLLGAALTLRSAAGSAQARTQDSILEAYVTTDPMTEEVPLTLEDIADAVDDGRSVGQRRRTLKDRRCCGRIFGTKALKATLWYTMSLLILIAYAALNFELSESTASSGRYLCFPTIATILLLDMLAALMYMGRIVQTPGALCLVLTGARIALIAYGTRYWLLGQCTVYAVTAIYLSHILVQQRLAQLTQKSAGGFWNTLFASADEPVEARVVTPLSLCARPTCFSSFADFRKWVRTWCVSPEGILAIHTSVFAAFIAGLAAAMDQYNSTLPNPQVPTIQGYVPQYAFGIGALCLVVVWLSFEILFALYTRGQRAWHGLGWVFAFGMWVAVIACGVGLYFTTDSSIILFSGIFTPPLVVATFALYGQWVKDDFQIFPGGIPVGHLRAILTFCQNLRRARAAGTAAAVAASPDAGGATTVAVGPAEPAATPTPVPAPAALKPMTPAQKKNLWMVAALLTVLGSLLGFGGAVSATVSPSYVGWVISGIVATLLCTAAPIIQWFQTLEYSHFQPVSLVMALGFHIGIHAAMLHTYDSDVYVKTTVGIAFSLCLYPSIVLLIVALYKLWDDRWKFSKFVTICLALSQLIILGFAIAAVIVFRDDVTAPAAILGSYIACCAAGFVFIKWVMNGFYLSRGWMYLGLVVIVAVFFGGLGLCLWEYFGNSRADRAILWFSVAYWTAVLTLAGAGVLQLRSAGAFNTSITPSSPDAGMSTPSFSKGGAAKMGRVSQTSARGSVTSPRTSQTSAGAGAMPTAAASPRNALMSAIKSGAELFSRGTGAVAANAGNRLYYSDYLFPVFTFSPQSGVMESAHMGPTLLFAAAFLGLLWGCLAMVFIVPIYAGVMVTNVVKVLLVLYIADCTRRSEAHLYDAISQVTAAWQTTQKKYEDTPELQLLVSMLNSAGPKPSGNPNVVSVMPATASDGVFTVTNPASVANPVASQNRLDSKVQQAYGVLALLNTVLESGDIAFRMTQPIDTETSAAAATAGKSESHLYQLGDIFTGRSHAIRAEAASLLSTQFMVSKWSTMQLLFPTTTECLMATRDSLRCRCQNNQNACAAQRDGTSLCLSAVDVVQQTNTGASKDSTAVVVAPVEEAALVNSGRPKRLQYMAGEDLDQLCKVGRPSFTVLTTMLTEVVKADNADCAASLRAQLFVSYLRHGILSAGASAASVQLASWTSFLAWLSEADQAPLLDAAGLQDMKHYHAIITTAASKLAAAQFRYPRPTVGAVSSESALRGFWERHVGIAVTSTLVDGVHKLRAAFNDVMAVKAAEAERRRREDEEAAARRAEEDRRRRDEEARIKAEEEAAARLRNDVAEQQRIAEENRIRAQRERLEAERVARERALQEQLAAAEESARRAAEDAARAQRAREEAEARARAEAQARADAEKAANEQRARDAERIAKERSEFERLQREREAADAARIAAEAALKQQLAQQAEAERRARADAEAAAALRAQQEAEAAEALRRHQAEIERLAKLQAAEQAAARLEMLAAQQRAAEEARRKAAEELARQQAATEAARRAEEAAARKRAEEAAAQQRAADEARRKAEAEAAAREAAEAQLRAAADAAAAQRARDEQRRAAEAEALRRQQAEAAARKAAEEAARRKQEEEAARRAAEAAAAAEIARQKLLEEQQRKRQEDERARIAAAAQAEAERVRRANLAAVAAAEEAARRKREEEAAAAAAAALNTNTATGSGGSGTDDQHATEVLATVKNMVADLKAKNASYNDGWTGPSSLGEMRSKDLGPWERAKSFAKDLRIVADGYDPKDIEQGSLGDCYLLSAFSVLAQHPALLDQVLLTKEVNEAGVYAVRLWKDGRWQEVFVDDRFLSKNNVYYDEKAKCLYSGKPAPAAGKFSAPIFVSSAARGELWMMILEKAYAKYYGTFGAIEGGFVHSALCDFVPGAVGEMITMSTPANKSLIQSGALWEKVQRYVSLGYLLGAGSPSGSDSDVAKGIVQGHAYAILNATEESDARGNHQLIQLRNPWGSTEWQGAWGDKDTTSWTRRLQNKLNYHPDEGGKEDGVFWMEWCDFTTHFEDIYVCRLFKTVEQGGPWYRYSVEGSWSGKSAGGCTNNPDLAQWNPQYYIMPTKPCNVFISLTQKHKVGAAEENECIGMKLLKKDGKRCKAVYAGQVALQSAYSGMKESVAEGNLTPLANPYTLFVSTFEAKIEKEFYLVVYSDAPLGMVDGSTLRRIPDSVPAA